MTMRANKKSYAAVTHISEPSDRHGRRSPIERPDRVT